MIQIVRPVVVASLLIAAVVGLVAPMPAAAYPAATVDLRGHGFGHGRGMGQYGALGYSLAGWPHTQILDYFYGGTAMGTIPDVPMSVRILRLDGQETLFVQERGAATTSAAPGQFQALRVRLIAANLFEVSSGPGCGGPWSVVVPAVPGPVTVGSALPQSDDRTTLLQLCEPGGSRWYRGDFAVLDSTGARTVNRVNMEAYLRGVVPRESPAAWGAMGEGRGMNALRSQAVAARSYAQGENRAAFARTCDTTACQVYGGFGLQDAAGYRDLEAAATNTAVAQTAGQIRVFPSTGAVALTEYSSSTGGYTAGGTFPAVPDDGDAVAGNPNRDWVARVPVVDVEAAYPAIGALLSVDVLRRNGLGDLGGRVLQLNLRGSRGTQTITGADFRRFVGVKSDWFEVTNNPVGAIGGYFVVAPDGGVFAFGGARFLGSTGAVKLNRPIVGMATTPSGNGYWLVASDGGIFAFGDARFAGSTGAIKLNKPIVGMAATPSGNGYWLVARDGGIFAFGDAVFRGSTGAIRLNQPVVGMAVSPSGNGYWLVAADGGIFAFGDGAFQGSTGAIRLNLPVVAMADTPSGNGYWLLASDGGIFAFGDATFRGSLPSIAAPGPARAIQSGFAGQGYLVLTDAGRVHTFGDAPWFGDLAAAVPAYRGGVRGLAVVRAP